MNSPTACFTRIPHSTSLSCESVARDSTIVAQPAPASVICQPDSDTIPLLRPLATFSVLHRSCDRKRSAVATNFIKYLGYLDCVRTDQISVFCSKRFSVTISVFRYELQYPIVEELCDNALRTRFWMAVYWFTKPLIPAHVGRRTQTWSSHYTTTSGVSRGEKGPQ